MIRDELGTELLRMDSYHAINDLLLGIKLHDKQCIDIIKMLYGKRSIVIYDTGTGKTLLAAAVMKLLLNKNPGQLCLMIVKKDQLIQTPQKIETLAGLTVICTTADSGFLKKNFFNKDLEKFDVIMITEECLLNTSVMNKLYELRDKLLCVIIDEAHELNNYTNAQSANMLKALITKVEYVYALTATPIVSDQIQLAKLANMLLPKEFPSASLLAKKLTSGKLTIEEYPFLFINRKASELGRMSEPRGHVVLVEPQPDQKNCNLGGVKLFQVCKGYGAINQINALNDVIQSQSGKGLVYVSQKSIMEWVMQNMGKNNISAAVINGEVVGEVRKQIINDFAAGEYKVIITSLTTALDMDCDFVIFYEFTVEIEQMIGRAHRGLNNKDLDVYFIVTEDTGEINYFLNNIVMRSDIIQKILNKRNKAVSDAAERLLPNVEC